MKIRQGFVSNSSSSSFVCDVSGYEVSGFDLCLWEVGMVQCKNGHTFREEYIIGSTEEAEQTYLANLKKNNPELSHWTDEDLLNDYYIPANNCPVCQFTTVTERDILALVLADKDFTKEQLAEEIKERFGTYEEFNKFIRG